MSDLSPVDAGQEDPATLSALAEVLGASVPEFRWLDVALAERSELRAELARTEGDLAVAVAEAGRLRAFARSLVSLDTDVEARSRASLTSIVDRARAALDEETL